MNNYVTEETSLIRHNGEYTIFYCLQKQKVSTQEDSSETETYVYSLLIVQHKSGEPAESRYFYDISRDAERAMEIFSVVSSNDVTICGSDEIIAELL